MSEAPDQLPKGALIQPTPNTLYQGDCLDVLRRWDDDCVDHALLDLPYNLSSRRGLPSAFSRYVTMHESWDCYSREEYLDLCRRWLGEVCRVVKPNGNLFLFGTFHNLYDLGHLLHELDRKILNSIIWYKPNAQPNLTCRRLTESTEQVIWACNAPKERATGWTFNYEEARRLNEGKQLRNVWTIPTTPPREKRAGRHPCQKPLALISLLLRIGTRPGDLVLDPFAGAGTTGVAAQELGRRWVLIERHSPYAKTARRRIKQT